jgi:hypothetical protein
VDVDWGKLPIGPPQPSLAILPAEPFSSKSEDLGQGNYGSCLGNLFSYS